MKRVLTLLLMLVSQGFAGITAEQKYLLDNYMGGVANQTGLGTLVAQGGGSAVVVDGIQAKQVLVATYDFSIHGGASNAAIGLGSSLPQGAVITRSYIDVITAPVGSFGGTLSVGTGESGNWANVVATTALASVTGQVEGVMTGTAATMRKLTADKELRVFISKTALTAGKFRVYAEYSTSAPNN